MFNLEDYPKPASTYTFFLNIHIVIIVKDVKPREVMSYS